MREEDKIVLFDMDGTLADYPKVMERDYELMMGPDESEHDMWVDEGFPYHRRDAISRQIGWWKDLPKIDYVFEFYNWITKEQGFCSHILTKGPKDKYPAWGEKLEWCREHVPDASVTITEDKSLCYGKILVDDYPEYAKPWLANRPRGMVIMPEHDYNRDFHHPSVYKFRSDNIDYIKATVIYKINNEW